MKSIDEILSAPFVETIEKGDDGALFNYRIGSRRYEIIDSNGGDWDHVSIVPIGQSYPPTWSAMCAIKDLCFNDDEVVMQLHPAKKDYVNVHNECLHLWKPQGKTIPTPPKIFV